MKYLKGHFVTLLSATAFIFTAGCTLDEPVPSTSKPALTLEYEQNLSLADLSWDQVNVTGFKEYILLQSSSPIPDAPTPQVNQDVTVLKRIKDVENHSFSVSPILFSPEVCFKLYCAMDDRFLYSQTLCIKQQVDGVEGFYDRACHTSGLDEMVLYDRVSNVISSCNYKTGTLTNTVPEMLLNFPSLEMSTLDNNTDVFGYDQSPAWLRKYTFPELTLTHSKNFSQILWAANVHDQFVFVGSDEPGKNFLVLSRSNLTTIDSRSGIAENQNIAIFPGNPLTVLALGQSESKKYTINSAGKITGEESITSRIPFPDLQTTCAEGNELFIGGQTGTIINRNGERIAALVTDNNSFIQMSRLSPDETKAVYLINNNGISHLEIADLSALPVITVLKSFDLPALSFSDVIPEGEIIYVIGTTFNNSQPQTYILQYPY